MNYFRFINFIKTKLDSSYIYNIYVTYAYYISTNKIFILLLKYKIKEVLRINTSIISYLSFVSIISFFIYSFFLYLVCHYFLFQFHLSILYE